MSALDDNGNPVPSVGFDYGALEPAGESAPVGGIDLDLVRLALFLVLGERERGTRVRLAALATITGFFRNASEAARKCRVSRSTMARAVKSLRRRLRECYGEFPKKG